MSSNTIVRIVRSHLCQMIGKRLKNKSVKIYLSVCTYLGYLLNCAFTDMTYFVTLDICCQIINNFGKSVCNWFDDKSTLRKSLKSWKHLHDHCRVFHYASTWSKLLNWRWGIQRSCSPKKTSSIWSSFYNSVKIIF